MLNTCLFIFLETLGLILLVSTTLDFGENILRYSPGSRRLNEWRISNRFWCLHPKIYQSQIFQAGNSAVVSYKMVFFLFVFFFPPERAILHVLLSISNSIHFLLQALVSHWSTIVLHVWRQIEHLQYCILCLNMQRQVFKQRVTITIIRDRCSNKGC